MNSSRIILDLCGGTGSWSAPYREAGYDVRIITKPALDVRRYSPPDGVHGVLAAPPCTEFAASGALHWARKPPYLLEEALAIVDACLRIIRESDPVWWALENPVGRLRRLRPELGDPALTFDPWEFGDPWTKKTLVWGKFALPERRVVRPLPGQWVHRVGGKSDSTKEARSETPPGFAREFFRANP